MILHGVEAGEGPPVVLLHGLFGRAQNLGALARRLSQSRRVISFDLRNHGASPHVRGMRYADMVEDVRESLVARGAWPASVVGHSMGGKVAMLLALLHPGEVRSLVVADIAPVAYAHQNRAIASALQALVLAPGLTRVAADAALAARVPDRSVRQFLLQNLVFSEPPRCRIGLDEIAGGLADIEGWPLEAEGKRYMGRAAFVIGGASDFVLLSHRPVIAGYFPAASFVAIPNAGHWLHAEQPEVFGEVVEKEV